MRKRRRALGAPQAGCSTQPHREGLSYNGCAVGGARTSRAGLAVSEAIGGTMDRVGKVVGYAPGVYDMFHIGHLEILRRAKSHCDFLVAGVVSDDMAAAAKGRRPVIPLPERLEIVRHIDYVDDVHAETIPDKLTTWAEVRFDVFFKGDDWRGTPKGAELERRFAAVGVQVVYFPYTMHTSSSLLRSYLTTPLADHVS